MSATITEIDQATARITELEAAIRLKNQQLAMATKLRDEAEADRDALRDQLFDQLCMLAATGAA